MLHVAPEHQHRVFSKRYIFSGNKCIKHLLCSRQLVFVMVHDKKTVLRKWWWECNPHYQEYTNAMTGPWSCSAGYYFKIVEQIIPSGGWQFLPWQVERISRLQLTAGSVRRMLKRHKSTRLLLLSAVVASWFIQAGRPGLGRTGLVRQLTVNNI